MVDILLVPAQGSGGKSVRSEEPTSMEGTLPIFQLILMRSTRSGLLIGSWTNLRLRLELE